MTLSYGNRVFIGGISSTVSKDDIGNEFGKFGKLRSIWLASKPPGKCPHLILIGPMSSFDRFRLDNLNKIKQIKAS